MAIIIGVRFREVGRVYYFDPGETQVQKGDRVIVETARGVECGEVVQENTDVPEEQIKRPLKTMIRVATEADLANVAGKAAKEAEAFKTCEERIAKHGLDMKLVNVEHTFDGGKIIFHFTADQRVDFRALVRDLAGVFRTRIELRQIGVRDEAKLLGGLGICGRPFCCSSFMGDFHPVSIKMAKEQGLSLNPTKISGTCGRLMRCLKYEEAAYADAMKTLPRIGSKIDTPEGPGFVTEVNAVSQAIKVRLERRMDAPPMAFQFSAEDGVTRRAPTTRMTDPLQGFIPREPLVDASPAPKPEQEQKPKPRQDQRPRNKNRGGQQQRQKQSQQNQQQPQGQQPKQGQPKQKPQSDQHKAGTGHTAHAGTTKGSAARRQRQPQRQNQQQQREPQPEQKQNQPPQVQQQVQPGEIRRANAPKPATQASDEKKPGGANYRRQPWQKRKKDKPQN